MRCYLRHSIVAVEEDRSHEFKAHRCLSEMDLSPLTFTLDRRGRASTLKFLNRRAPISAAFCGMLNTGLGGTFFLGVSDAGAAEGFMMSVFQKDHFLLALADLLGAYSPPVPPHMYRVRFVPVVDEDEVTFRPDPVVSSLSRDLPHEMREPRYCWCDVYTCAALERGVMHRFYVIEVSFAAWDPGDLRNADLVMTEAPEVSPIFESEEGKSFLRKNGRTSMMTLKCVRELAKEKLEMARLSSEEEKRDSGMPTSLSFSTLSFDSESEEGFESYGEEEYERDCHRS